MKKEKKAAKIIKWLLALTATALAAVTFVKSPNPGSLLLLLAAILIMPINFNKQLWGSDESVSPANFSRSVFRLLLILILLVFGFICISDSNALKTKDNRITELEKRYEALSTKYELLNAKSESSASDNVISSSDVESSEPHTYVLNVKSGKFHYDWCDSVEQIKEKNKEVITAAREEMISQGYQPCGECQP